MWQAGHLCVFRDLNLAMLVERSNVSTLLYMCLRAVSFCGLR